MNAALNWQIVGPAAIEILILFGILYAVMRFLQGTRGAGILRGLAFVMVTALLILLVLVDKLSLHRIEFLAHGGFAWMFVAILVLFQPEIRRVFIRLGEYPLIRWFLPSDPTIIEEVVAAAERLSRLKMGGLIAIQRETGLASYVEGGKRLDALVSADLLINIFWPGSPLHDGAVVIANDRIVAAGCLFPLTESIETASGTGTRHRAGVGVTEESDAVAVIVSEETGRISAAFRGNLTKGLDGKGLQHLLEAIITESNTLAEDGA